MNSFENVKDTGERQEFDTGSQRDTQEGKGYYHLLPPEAIRRLAVHLENGAKKYGENNWRKGQPLTRYCQSALRHVFNYIEGHRDEDHMAAAVWNLMAVIETETMVKRGLLPEELADMPDYLSYASGHPEEADLFTVEAPEPELPRYFKYEAARIGAAVWVNTGEIQSVYVDNRGVDEDAVFTEEGNVSAALDPASAVEEISRSEAVSIVGEAALQMAENREFGAVPSQEGQSGNQSRYYKTVDGTSLIRRVDPDGSGWVIIYDRDEDTWSVCDPEEGPRQEEEGNSIEIDRDDALHLLRNHKVTV